MIAVYIHIPFCQTICSYCDFCKLYYDKRWVKDYLIALQKEIIDNYKGEKVRTLYIGGGTPSILDIDELTFLFDILNIFDLSSLEEFTIECNVESLNLEKLTFFKNKKVNRISIGVQTFNKKHLSLLNRNHNKKDVFKIIKLIKEIGFNNINIDLIYGIPNQTLKDLKEDLKLFLKLNIPHISVYSLSIENNTKLKINNINEINDELNYQMYRYINKVLTKHHYVHYEISNYAKEGYQSKHNMVYWNNEEYYGFGLGACSYLNGIRKENTRSLTNYLKNKYQYKINLLTKKEMMENEMILGLRKINGIDKQVFKNKYKCKVETVFPIKKLIKDKVLIEKENKLFIPSEKLFIANEILINFLD